MQEQAVEGTVTAEPAGLETASASGETAGGTDGGQQGQTTGRQADGGTGQGASGTPTAVEESATDGNAGGDSDAGGSGGSDGAGGNGVNAENGEGGEGGEGGGNSGNSGNADGDGDGNGNGSGAAADVRSGAARKKIASATDADGNPVDVSTIVTVENPSGTGTLSGTESRVEYRAPLADVGMSAEEAGNLELGVFMIYDGDHSGFLMDAHEVGYEGDELVIAGAIAEGTYEDGTKIGGDDSGDDDGADASKLAGNAAQTLRKAVAMAKSWMDMAGSTVSGDTKAALEKAIADAEAAAAVMDEVAETGKLPDGAMDKAASALTALLGATGMDSSTIEAMVKAMRNGAGDGDGKDDDKGKDGDKDKEGEGDKDKDGGSGKDGDTPASTVEVDLSALGYKDVDNGLAEAVKTYFAFKGIYSGKYTATDLGEVTKTMGLSGDAHAHLIRLSSGDSVHDVLAVRRFGFWSVTAIPDYLKVDSRNEASDFISKLLSGFSSQPASSKTSLASMFPSYGSSSLLSANKVGLAKTGETAAAGVVAGMAVVAVIGGIAVARKRK
jgi:hypothetical protein